MQRPPGINGLYDGGFYAASLPQQLQHQEEVCYRTPATVCANIHHLQSPTLPHHHHHQRGFLDLPTMSSTLQMCVFSIPDKE